MSRSNETCRDTVKDVAKGDGTIIDDINEHLDTIRRKFPGWPEYVIRLAAAVLMTYEYRFVDITEIELVTLIYCGEGDTGIRAHKGTAWLYYNGGFRAFDGLCSKSVLKRMRLFMKHCEGLYKSFKDEKDLPTSQAILEQIQSHYSKAGDLDEFKRYLIQKANVGFSRKGGGKGKSKDRCHAGGAGDSVDDDIDDSTDVNVSWNDSMKQHWHRISKRIFDGMLTKGLLPYFNEWCETTKVVARGCACEDSCFLIGDDGPNFATNVKKSPSNNI